ncbi:MAG TPA: hypothetical protein VKB35_16695 [Ktedonobacteraceae bacterium]|nr:hypothetical protein [Ktedonobacteraceae bacterium]
MECIEPGAIRDEELLAYLAGERVRPVVAQHLTKCQHCSSHLADYRQIENMLTIKLYRWDCPPNQVLGEYHLGLLRKDLAIAVRMHLNTCVLCAAEVRALSEFLADDPLLVARPQAAKITVLPSALNNHRPARGTERVLDQLRNRSAAGIRRIVAILQPAQPRLAYERNGAPSTLWPRHYMAEDVSISIQIELGASRADSLQLIGFVTRTGAALEALQGTPVLLSSQASPVRTQDIDELGNFVFSSLSPATYTLELQFPESTIVIDQLPVTLQN